VKDAATDLLSEIRNAPKPVVHSPDQSEGDVADMPFFPNPRIEEERLRRAEEERRRQAEEEQARKEEDERLRRAEEERVRQAEEERRHQAEEEAKLRQAEEQARKIEEERIRKSNLEQAVQSEQDASTFVKPDNSRRTSVPRESSPGASGSSSTETGIVAAPPTMSQSDRKRQATTPPLETIPPTITPLSLTRVGRRRSGAQQTSQPTASPVSKDPQVENVSKRSSGSFKFKGRYILGIAIYLFGAQFIGIYEKQFLTANHLVVVLVHFFGLTITTLTVVYLATLLVLLVVLVLLDLIPRSLPTTWRTWFKRM
jgi:hypothetical protein